MIFIKLFLFLREWLQESWNFVRAARKIDRENQVHKATFNPFALLSPFSKGGEQSEGIE
jgi:hypothetical protein